MEDEGELLKQISMDDNANLSREEALAKVSLILANTDKPKILSDIDIREVGYTSALSTVGEFLDIPMLNTFIHQNFLQLRVSKDRKGRNEILEIAREIRIQPEREGSLRSRFFGLR